MSNANLQIVISGKDEASAAVKGLHTSIGQLAAGVALGQAAFEAFKTTVRMAVGVFKDVISSANESEFADVKLTQALKHVSGATEEQIADMKKYANTLQFQTGMSDESIKSGMAMAATFKLNTEQIKKMTPALMDMAAMYKRNTGEAVNLEQVAIMVGKATGGELYKNLQRVGVIFDDNQLKMLENADVAGRLKIVTEELGNEFGGQALAQADTFAGKMTIMGLYFDEVKEKIGLALFNGLTPFVNKLVEWVKTDQAQALLENIGTKVGELATKMGFWITDVAIPWVQTHWPEIKRVAEEVMTAVYNAVKFVVDFVKSPEGKIILAIETAFVLAEIAKVALAAKGLTSTQYVLIIGAAIFLVIKEFKKIGEAWQGFKKETEGQPLIMKLKFIAEGSLDTLNKMFTGQWSTLWGEFKSSIGWRASGGSVSKNSPYMVGEQGPELFVPSTSGSIIPNNKVGGGITINFYGDIQNTSDVSLDHIGQRLARQLELSGMGV